MKVMKKLQIYISKSNQSDPEHLIKVRHALKSLADVSAAEFSGGAYSPTTLLNSDAMLVIPKAGIWLDVTNGDNFMLLSKGIYSEALRIRERCKPVWIFHPGSEKFYWIHKLSLNDPNAPWDGDYGRCDVTPNYWFEWYQIEHWIHEPSLFAPKLDRDDYNFWGDKNDDNPKHKDTPQEIHTKKEDDQIDNLLI